MATILDLELQNDDVRQRIESIKNDIQGMRKTVDLYSIRNSNYNLLNVPTYNDMPLNVISILGDRGSGKTTNVLTLHKELYDDNYEQIGNSIITKNVNFKNTLLDIIDPARFNVEKNALGWIIYSFDKYVDIISRKKDTEFCTKESVFISCKNSYEKLKEAYVQSRPFFRKGASDLTNGSFEYKQLNEEIIFSDMKLLELFRKFIDNYILAVNKLRNKKGNDSRDPLIIITFDDIDISPQYGYSILHSVLNYLKHPNIVILILGEISTFKEGTIIDFINKEKIPAILDRKEGIVFDKDKIVKIRRERAEEFLEKVMPNQFRYELMGFSEVEKFNFIPSILKGFNSHETPKNLLEVIASQFKIFNSKYELKGNMSLIFKNRNVDYDNIIVPLRKIISKDRTNLMKSDEDLRIHLDYCDMLNNQLTVYCDAIFETPRGLEQFYQLIKTNKFDLISIKEFENDKKFRGFNDLTKIYKNNYTTLSKLFKIMKKYKTINRELDIDEIINFRDEKGIINIDFSTLKIDYDYHVDDDGFYELDGIVELFYKETRLSSSACAFIQLFYDICKVFLPKTKINIIADKDISNIPIYKSEQKLCKIVTCNFDYFNDFYILRKLLKMNHPVIVGDRKDHVKLRKDLKLFIIFILDLIRNQKYTEAFMFSDNEVQSIDWSSINSIKKALVVYPLKNISKESVTLNEYDLDSYVFDYVESESIIINLFEGRVKPYELTALRIYDMRTSKDTRDKRIKSILRLIKELGHCKQYDGIFIEIEECLKRNNASISWSEFFEISGKLERFLFTSFDMFNELDSDELDIISKYIDNNYGQKFSYEIRNVIQDRNTDILANEITSAMSIITNDNRVLEIGEATTSNKLRKLIGSKKWIELAHYFNSSKHSTTKFNKLLTALDKHSDSAYARKMYESITDFASNNSDDNEKLRKYATTLKTDYFTI